MENVVFPNIFKRWRHKWALVSFSNVCAWNTFTVQVKASFKIWGHEKRGLPSLKVCIENETSGRRSVGLVFTCVQPRQLHLPMCTMCTMCTAHLQHLCPSYFVLTMYQVHIIKYINWCCNLSRFGIIDCFSFFNSGSSNVSPVFSTHVIRIRKNTAATFVPLDLHPYWSTNAQ